MRTRSFWILPRRCERDAQWGFFFASARWGFKRVDVSTPAVFLFPCLYLQLLGLLCFRCQGALHFGGFFCTADEQLKMERREWYSSILGPILAHDQIPRIHWVIGYWWGFSRSITIYHDKLTLYYNDGTKHVTKSNPESFSSFPKYRQVECCFSELLPSDLK